MRVLLCAPKAATISAPFPSSRSGFGYMTRNNGQSLIRYDKESNSFVEHALPEDPSYRLVDEEGHLMLIYKDRLSGTADYYLFDNISW